MATLAIPKFHILNGVGIREYRALSFVYAFVAVLFWYLSDNIPMGLFSTWAVICCMLNDSIFSLTTLLFLLAGYGLYAVARHAIDTEIKIDIVLDVLIVLVLFQCAWQWLQVYSLDPLFLAKQSHGGNEIFCGWTGNRNLLAAMIALSFPAFLRGKRVFLLPVAIAGLYLCDTATAVIALACGMLVYFMVKVKISDEWRFVWIAIIAGVGCLYMQLFDQWNILVNDRWIVWRESIDLWKHAQWKGLGLGTYKILFPQYKGIIGGLTWKQAHNDYLQVLFEMGIPGLMLVFAYVGRLIWKMLKYSISPVLAAIFVIMLINSAGHFPWHTVDNALWYVVILACIESHLSWRVEG